MNTTTQQALSGPLRDARARAVQDMEDVTATVKRLDSEMAEAQKRLDRLSREIDGLDLALGRFSPLDEGDRSSPLQAEALETAPVDETTPRTDAVLSILAHLGGEAGLEQLEEVMAAHGQGIGRSRISAALSYGKSNERIESAGRGRYRITEEGLDYARRRDLAPESLDN